jgi:hypothetical protein
MEHISVQVTMHTEKKTTNRVDSLTQFSALFASIDEVVDSLEDAEDELDITSNL